MIGTELPDDVQGMCYTDMGVFSHDLSDCDVVDEVPEGYPSQCVETFQRRAPDNSVHGTAVSEAVIDIAPGASLYVANPISQADMQNVVDWMASQGVSVINYSVSYIFDGPGDGTSPSSVSPLNTVDQAVANDILWVNSAGNSADNIWFGDYSDPDGDGAIGFGGQNDEVIDFSLRECRSFSFQLRWEDSWGAARTDLDVHLYHKPSRSIVRSSTTEQSGKSGDIPFEWIPLIAFTDSEEFGIVVSHSSGPVPDWIQLLYRGPGAIEHYTVNGSIGNPAESANRGLLAVGAAHYWDTHTIAEYSSQGPTPDGRVKPDIVGTDCAEAASYDVINSARFDYNPCWFPGTSQASPHVAGMAALVRQRFPDFSAEQTAQYLKDNAEQRRGRRPNNTWGYGFAVLPPIEGATAAECTQELPPGGTVTDTWAAGCQSEIPAPGPGSGARFARYYTFEVTEQSQVTIDLTSSTDTFLYLREGNATSGGALHENDDIESGNTNSRIQATLESGSYTIEATTYDPGQTGSFTLTVTGLDGAAAPGAGCGDAIAVGVPASGTWAAGCQSAVSGRGYARYYTFTLEEQSPVTIDLTSSVDTYLYLRAGDATSGATLHENDDIERGNTNSRIQATLAAGTYTIEATTYNAGETGSFTLTVSTSGDADAPGTGCGDSIALGDATSGTWAAGCQSTVSGRGYARYYTFALEEQSPVTIDLTSSVDTYLYLRAGDATSGATLHENDDIESGNTNSRITATLDAGTYTIEATTYDESETGSFALTVSASADTGGTGTGCGDPIALGDATSGTWAASCQSTVSGRGYARYYTLTLEEQSPVTIDLTSSVDTYLYLREGDATSGTALHENDDIESGNTNSRIEETLATGTYTIEATTYSQGETGSFILTVSTSGDTGGTGTSCGDSITVGDTASGTWAAGCQSSVSGRGYARYYTFTLAQESEVTVTLRSEDIDPYLYLREGEAQSGTFLHENDDHDGSLRVSQITAMLPANTYTIEATTYSPAQTGSFTLTVSTSSGTATTPGDSDCETEAMQSDGSIERTWAAGCVSQTEALGSGSGDRLARYYTFTLAADREVTITLESTQADTYLYLRSGNARSGATVDGGENDDIESGNTNSRITTTLDAATYTIEATTYRPGESGSFTLTVSGLGS